MRSHAGGMQGTRVRLHKVMLASLGRSDIIDNDSDCEIFCVAFNARSVNLKRVGKNKYKKQLPYSILSIKAN